MSWPDLATGAGVGVAIGLVCAFVVFYFLHNPPKE
jgi:hypothetical protein